MEEFKKEVTDEATVKKDDQGHTVTIDIIAEVTVRIVVAEAEAEREALEELQDTVIIIMITGQAEIDTL